jgi:hypothetical protein
LGLSDEVFDQEIKLNPIKNDESSQDFGQLDNQLLPVLGISKVERLAIECQRPEYRAPCKTGQKWQCVYDGSRSVVKFAKTLLNLHFIVEILYDNFLFNFFKTIDNFKSRWRKHKCKQRLNIFPHLRAKKCACFTPSGTMYTRFEPDERRYQKDIIR